VIKPKEQEPSYDETIPTIGTRQ